MLPCIQLESFVGFKESCVRAGMVLREGTEKERGWEILEAKNPAHLLTVPSGPSTIMLLHSSWRVFPSGACPFPADTAKAIIPSQDPSPTRFHNTS